MKLGDTIIASQLAGDFTLPRNRKTKLAFIIGGIGVTPFRSMVKYLLDKKEMRPIVIFYSNKIEPDIVYKEIFDEAERQLGIKTIYTLTDIQLVPLDWNEGKGYISEKMIMEAMPDYKERMFYISGPHGMVVDFKKILKEINVKNSRIRTDFFPGLV